MGAEQAPTRCCNSPPRRRSGAASRSPRKTNSRCARRAAGRYEEQTDIRYGAARGWVDAIIAPHETRNFLRIALGMIPEKVTWGEFRTGVFQV